MIICNTRKFIYIHLYKCAGTSIECALSDHLSYNDILVGSTAVGEEMQGLFNGLIGLHKHSDARDVYRFVGKKSWSRYLSFSTVRNPFAFAVSQYNYSMDHLRSAISIEGEPWGKDILSYDCDSLPDQWPWMYPGVRALIANRGEEAPFSDFIRANELKGWRGFSPLYERLCDENGKLLVNRVIKMEELNAAWSGLVSLLGMPEIPLSKKNDSSSGGGSLKKYFADADDVRFIQARFATDFEMLGYDHDLGSYDNS